MPSPNGFEELMARLRTGDDEAAAQVFDRFVQRLIYLAQSQLDQWTRQKVDPEDIVQSVYRSFFQRYRRGQFDFAGWDSLWGMLTVITVRKCINRARSFRVAGRDVEREVPLELAADGSAAYAGLESREPGPLEAAILAETVEQLMHDLDDREREMFSLSLQGRTVQEISPLVGRSERTVQRLLARIRKRLQVLQEEV
jgi:RNA polymerase sigma-70 factor (ECF subfamily)